MRGDVVPRGRVVGWFVLAVGLIAWLPGLFGQAALAAPVVPHLRGVYDPGGGQPLQALWGYTNKNASAVTIPFGGRNLFLPSPSIRDQPTSFAPGAVYAAFVTPLDEPELTWSLWYGTEATALTATASAASPSLPFAPEMLLGPGAIVPFVRRVWSEGPDDHYAEFGYASALATAVIIPYGGNNLFLPSPTIRDQPSQFQPGLVASAFVARFHAGEESITWRVTHNGVPREAVAFAPVPEPAGLAILAAAAGVLVARRPRRQERFSVCRT